ncbi:hypothetical protein VTH06DRAFT_5985 [Thermothelomyces fergusii]
MSQKIGFAEECWSFVAPKRKCPNLLYVLVLEEAGHEYY